jgi:tripartite-type tricarboxylate transporter receptor subunit TctC
MARILAERMKVTLGETVLVENVTGAGGSIGVGRAAKSPADGYTISFGHLGTHVATARSTSSTTTSWATSIPSCCCRATAWSSSARMRCPRRRCLSFWSGYGRGPAPAAAGTAGAGSGSHIAGLYFENVAGIKLQYVPYRGTGPALNDLVAGQIDLIVDQLSNSIQQVRGGTIRAYAVTDSKRAESAADIPDGRRGRAARLSHDVVVGDVGAQGTPKDIIAKLNASVVEAMSDPAVRKQFENLGLQMTPKDKLTPEALGEWQKAEIAKWWPVIKAANVKVD